MLPAGTELIWIDNHDYVDICVIFGYTNRLPWAVEWALRTTQNILMPKDINKTIAIIIILEGIEKIKTEQMTPKQSEQSSEHLQVEWLYFPWMKIHN